MRSKIVLKNAKGARNGAQKAHRAQENTATNSNNNQNISWQNKRNERTAVNKKAAELTNTNTYRRNPRIGLNTTITAARLAPHRRPPNELRAQCAFTAAKTRKICTTDPIYGYDIDLSCIPNIIHHFNIILCNSFWPGPKILYSDMCSIFHFRFVPSHFGSLAVPLTESNGSRSLFTRHFRSPCHSVSVRSFSSYFGLFHAHRFLCFLTMLRFVRPYAKCTSLCLSALRDLDRVQCAYVEAFSPVSPVSHIRTLNTASLSLTLPGLLSLHKLTFIAIGF